MKKAVVFDFDFTLGDSAEAIVASANFALEKMGYPQAEEDKIRKTIGLSLAKTLEALTGNEKDGAVFEKYFREKADEIMAAGTTLYDGVVKMLASLKKKGIKTAIVTTKYHYRIGQILALHEIPELIDEIIGGDDVNKPKPDPEGMNLLSERLGIGMEEMLYVGDSIVDAKTAEAAGVDFIAVLTGTTGAEEFAPYPCEKILKTAAELVF